MSVTVRPEHSLDAAAIRQVVEAAFTDAEHGVGSEWQVVDALREARALTASMVALSGGTVVAHAAFSPVTIGGEALGWHGLGPVSVRPDMQGNGIGAALIHAGLERLREAGAGGCVVLGEPHYYRRFGFEHDPALVYGEAPAEYFLALSLDGSHPQGMVAYHPAFDLPG